MLLFFLKKSKIQINKELFEASLITKASWFLFFLGFEGFLFTEFVLDIVKINFNYIIFIYLSFFLSIVDKFLFYLRKNLLFSVIYFFLIMTMVFVMIDKLFICTSSFLLSNSIIILLLMFIHYYLTFMCINDSACFYIK